MFNYTNIPVPPGIPVNLNPLEGGNTQEGCYHGFSRIKQFLEDYKMLIGCLNEKNIITDREGALFLADTDREIAEIGYAVHCFEVNKSRVVSSKIVPLITKLPDFTRNIQYVNRLPEPRSYKITFFNGIEKDVAIWCKEFLRRVMKTAENQNLDEPTTIDFLLNCCTKNAANEVSELVKYGKSLEQIVRHLETLYCGLTAPDLAAAECAKVFRKPGEKLHDLSGRIRDLAFMACRLKPDGLRMQEEMHKATFLDAVDRKLRIYLRDKEQHRQEIGNPPLSTSDLVSEGEIYEQEFQTASLLSRAKGSVEGKHYVRHIPEDENSSSGTESSEQESEVSSEGVESETDTENIRRLKYKKYKQKKSHKFSKHSKNKGGRKRFKNKVFQVEDNEGDSDSSTNSQEIWNESEQICFIKSPSGNKYQRITASDLNVEKNECWRCGLTGHFAFGRDRDKCPLNKQPITNTACSYCKKGGHIPQVCPKKKGQSMGKGRIYACQEDSEESENEPIHAINVIRGAPHVTIKINHIRINAIVDSGADKTLCRRSIAEQIYGPEVEEKIRNSNSKLKSATGHRLQVFGEIIMDIQIGGAIIKHPVLIVDDTVPPFLLGNDFMLNRVSLHKGRLFQLHGVKKGNSIIVPINYNPRKMSILASKKETVPPQSSKLIIGRLQIEQGTDEEKKLLIGSKLVLSDKDQENTEIDFSHKKRKKDLVMYSDRGYNVNDVVTRVGKDAEVVLMITNGTEEIVEINPNEALSEAELVVEEEEGIFVVHSAGGDDGYDSDPEITGETIRACPTRLWSDIVEMEGNPWVANGPNPKGEQQPNSPRGAYPFGWNPRNKKFKNNPREKIFIHPKQKTYVPPEEVAKWTNEQMVNFLHDPESYSMAVKGPTVPGKDFPDPAGYEAPKDVKIEYDQLKLKSLSGTQRARLLKVLKKHDKVFSKGSHDFGRTDLMTFKIDTGDAKPIAARYIPISARDTDEVVEIVEGLEKSKVIEECDSPWNSTVVTVRKPNGKMRLCINLKNVNSVTVNSTSYPINYQEESYAKLCNGKYFFRLDLSQAYYAIPLHSEEDRNKTAFSVVGRQYRFICSPFGAKYLPSQFNRLMSMIFKGANKNLFFYFDDVIASTQSFEELLSLLDDTLGRIEKANLRVNFEKSEFFLTTLDEIKWLGSIIKGNSLHPDPQKVKSILEMPMPSTQKGMQRFLGSVSYIRKHLPNIGEILGPLYKCCAGANKKLVITEKEKMAFELAKKSVSSAEALLLPNLQKEFIVTTDASGTGVGGVLSQIDDEGRERPVAYCSKVFSDTELHQSACEKELSAIVYAFTVFNYYLVSKPFTLVVDCKGLVYGQYFKGKNPKIYKTFMGFNELDFTVKHQPATRNSCMFIADMLSRAYVPDDSNLVQKASYKVLRNNFFNKLEVPKACTKGQVMKKSEFWKHVDEYLKKFVADNKIELRKIGPHLTNYARSLLEGQAIPFGNEIDLLEDVINYSQSYIESQAASEVGSIYRITSDVNSMTPEEDDIHQVLNVLVEDSLFSREGFQIAQLEDEHLQKIIHRLRQFDDGHRDCKFFLRKGILCKDVERDGQIKPVIVIPRQLVELLLNRYHSMNNTAAHIGRKRMFEQMRSTFFWPTLANDIKDFCRRCMICKYHTKNADPAYELQRTERAKEPNEIVNIDLVGPFQTSTRGYRYILTMQDDFSKFVQAIPLKTKTGEGVAHAFVTGWVGSYGKPKILRSDNGTEVDAGIMKNLCYNLGIRKYATPIYSPHCNPVERWHATLAEMLRTWIQSTGKPKQWASIVPFITLQYNHTPHTVTKIKPCMIFLGRDTTNGYMVPIIPEDDPCMTQHEYLAEIQSAQKILVEIARRNLDKDKERKVSKLGRHTAPREYKIGDKVLVKMFVRTKLDPKFVGPYTVVKVAKNVLHVLRYIDAKNLEVQEKFRKKNEPDTLGRIEKRVVHVSDVKLIDNDIELQPTWEAELAKQFFKSMKIEYNLENESRTSDPPLEEPGPAQARADPSDSDSSLHQEPQYHGVMTRARAAQLRAKNPEPEPQVNPLPIGTGISSSAESRDSHSEGRDSNTSNKPQSLEWDETELPEPSLGEEESVYVIKNSPFKKTEQNSMSDTEGSTLFESDSEFSFSIISDNTSEYLDKIDDICSILELASENGECQAIFYVNETSSDEEMSTNSVISESNSEISTDSILFRQVRRSRRFRNLRSNLGSAGSGSGTDSDSDSGDPERPLESTPPSDFEYTNVETDSDENRITIQSGRLRHARGTGFYLTFDDESTSDSTDMDIDFYQCPVKKKSFPRYSSSSDSEENVSFVCMVLEDDPLEKLKKAREKFNSKFNAKSSAKTTESGQINEMVQKLDTIALKYKSPQKDFRPLHSTPNQASVEDKTFETFKKLMDSKMLSREEKLALENSFRTERRRSEYSKAKPTIIFNGKQLAEWNEFDCRNWCKTFKGGERNKFSFDSGPMLNLYPLIKVLESSYDRIPLENYDERIASLKNIADQYQKMEDSLKVTEISARIAQIELEKIGILEQEPDLSRFGATNKPIPTPRTPRRGMEVTDKEKVDIEIELHPNVNTRDKQKTAKNMPDYAKMFETLPTILPEDEFPRFGSEVNTEPSKVEKYIQQLFDTRSKYTVQYNDLYTRFFDISLRAKQIIEESEMNQLYNELYKLEKLCLESQRYLVSEKSFPEKAKFVAEKSEILEEWEQHNSELVQRMHLEASFYENENWEKNEENLPQIKGDSQTFASLIKNKMIELEKLENSQLGELQGQEVKLDQQIKNVQSEIENLTLSIAEKEACVKTLQFTQDSKVKLSQSLSAIINQAEQKITGLSLEIKTLYEQDYDSKQKIGMLESDYKELQTKVNLSKEELNVLLEKLSSVENDFESTTQSYQYNLNLYHNSQGNLQNKQSERDHIVAETKAILANYMEITREIEQLNETMSREGLQNKELEQRKIQTWHNVSELKLKNIKLEQDIKGYQRDLYHHKCKYDELTRMANAERANLVNERVNLLSLNTTGDDAKMEVEPFPSKNDPSFSQHRGDESVGLNDTLVEPTPMLEPSGPMVGPNAPALAPAKFELKKATFEPDKKVDFSTFKTPKKETGQNEFVIKISSGGPVKWSDTTTPSSSTVQENDIIWITPDLEKTSNIEKTGIDPLGITGIPENTLINDLFGDISDISNATALTEVTGASEAPSLSPNVTQNTVIARSVPSTPKTIPRIPHQASLNISQFEMSEDPGPPRSSSTPRRPYNRDRSVDSLLRNKSPLNSDSFHLRSPLRKKKEIRKKEIKHPQTLSDLWAYKIRKENVPHFEGEEIHHACDYVLKQINKEIFGEISPDLPKIFSTVDLANIKGKQETLLGKIELFARQANTYNRQFNEIFRVLPIPDKPDQLLGLRSQLPITKDEITDLTKFWANSSGFPSHFDTLRKSENTFYRKYSFRIEQNIIAFKEITKTYNRDTLSLEKRVHLSSNLSGENALTNLEKKGKFIKQMQELLQAQEN